MKKSTVVAVTLLIIGAITFAACAPAAPAAPAEEAVAVEEEAAPAEEPIKLVLARVGGDPFYKTVECGALAEAERLGVELQVQSMANFEVAEQTRVLDAIIQTKPDAIITAPVEPIGVAPVFERILEAGITIVTYDTRLDDTSLTQAEVITDNFEQGKLAAQALAEAIGETGKVFILSDTPGIYTTEQEQLGFEEEIQKYPNIEYLGTEFHNNDQMRGAEIVNSKLVAVPDLAGIFATNTFGSIAVAAALRESGKVGDVKVVAYDTPQEIIDGLKEGVFQAVLAYEAYKEGVLAVQAAVNLVKGEPVEKLQMVGNVVITLDNVDDPDLAYLRYVDECN